MARVAMDYTKFFAKVTNRRRANMIRQMTKTFFMYPNSISLASGMPNSNMFPIEEISVTFKDGVKHKLQDQELLTSLQYGNSQGYLPLIKKWREFQESWHSPKRNDWDVLFVPGSQDGCNKVFEMLIDEGQPVMVQTPTYTGTIGSISSLQPDFIPIEQDANGIIPNVIAEVCEGRLKNGRPIPKLLYVNPTGANPTGSVLSNSRKREIYELAQKYNFLIIEDDPYYFLHFLEEQPISMFSLDTDGRVIRLDSFSKIMSAGIRVGVVTAHKDIIDKLVIHVENTILHTSSLSQMLLYKLFEAWEPKKFEQHFKEIQCFYRGNRDVMLATVEKHLSGLAEWIVPQGGMFVWVKIKGIDNVLDLVMNKVVPQGVFVLPGNAFNYDITKPDRHIRLCYSYATPEEIDKGLSIVASVIRKETLNKTSGYNRDV